MILYLLKKKRFIISVLFLGTLLTLSFWNTFMNDGEISQVMFTKDDNGKIVHFPPHAPLEVFILGSDQFGYSIADQMIEGAKYTIGIVLIITILRVLTSLFLSYFTYSLKPAIYKGMKTLFEPFTVIPQTFIAYFILFSVLWMPEAGFTHSFLERASFQIFILVIISVPSLTVQLSNEMRSLQREPFIEAATTLGGRKPHIFFKHLVPILYEKWILLFGHQFLQVLLVLAHLGIFELFFGGTKVTYGMSTDPPRSMTNEWSGIIGNSISFFYAQQWRALVPFAFFTLTALSVALINDSLKSMFNQREIQTLKKTENKASHTEAAKMEKNKLFHRVQESKRSHVKSL